MNTQEQLNKAERTEPLYMTFGRIKTRAFQLRDERLNALVEKLDKDLSNAKVIENYSDCKHDKSVTQGYGTGDWCHECNQEICL